MLASSNALSEASAALSYGCRESALYGMGWLQRRVVAADNTLFAVGVSARFSQLVIKSLGLV